jgi:hypothetical protein
MRDFKMEKQEMDLRKQMKLSKEQIDSFFEVLNQLRTEQKGIFGLDRGYRFDISVLKYVGIGEGMEYELAEDFELKELKNELYKFNEVKK